MNEKLFQALRESGADVDATIERFCGNSDMYEKFIRKFPDDGTFFLIKPAFESKDPARELETTHTLKGVSGNLGFTRLYKATSDTVALIRAKEYDKAAASYPEIEAAYNEIINIINSNED
jgi:histidine phosphotransfer protein HptB